MSDSKTSDADFGYRRVKAEEKAQLVRRVFDTLDASGAPNPSVPEVCRELLKDIEAVPWDALVDEVARARAARRAGGDEADAPGGLR